MAAALTLAVMGFILIWKGATNDILRTRMGDAIIPRWAYLFGGIVMLSFTVMLFVVHNETGRAWLGLSTQ
jgi:hypothetical protein